MPVKRIALSIAALLLMMMQSSLAQVAPQPTEAQLQQAQAAMFQSQAQFLGLAGQRLQKQLIDAEAEMAATKKYWEKYIGKPADPAAPQ